MTDRAITARYTDSHGMECVELDDGRVLVLVPFLGRIESLLDRDPDPFDVKAEALLISGAQASLLGGGGMAESAPEYARLYLDVDGVLNAVTRKVPDWGWERHQTKRICGYPINWSPDLIDVLNAVAETPGLGVYWLTTWCHDAPKVLAPALGLNGADWPVVGYEHWRDSRGLPWWKHLAIVEHLEGFDGGVLWIDDDHGVDPACKAWLGGQPQVLTVAPGPGLGITRSEADLIERFASEVATRPGVTP